jgi:hypothetical protein
MIDEDRSTWTLGQLADEVIEACELPMGCRGTIIAALGDAKDQGRAVGEERLRERAERMRQHILTKVVGRLCEPVTGRSAGWGCGLCGGQGKGPADGTRDLEAITHEPDCMCVPLATITATPADCAQVPTVDYPSGQSGESGDAVQCHTESAGK